MGTSIIERADRNTGQTGGGLAIIYKEHLKLKFQKPSTYLQFECMIATINTYNSPIIICAVYRPLPSQRNGFSTPAFMTEWCQFMSELTTNNPELVIVGDINIHLGNTSLCHTQNFMKSLEATGLQQHI